MKIYTRGGDDGSTGLYGGRRVSKADPRVEAYGQVDELNAVLGWVRAAELPPAVDATLAAAQEACFRLGAVLASDAGTDPGVPAPGAEDVLRLEKDIDALDAELPTLRTFILPGGTEAAARLHVARTTCRRAERGVVALGFAAAGVLDGVRWLNRLSDWLFVAARFANHRAAQPDVPWLGK